MAKKAPPKKNGDTMMDDKEMARCMKSGKSHAQCMKTMGSKKTMPMKKGMC